MAGHGCSQGVLLVTTATLLLGGPSFVHSHATAATWAKTRQQAWNMDETNTLAPVSLDKTQSAKVKHFDHPSRWPPRMLGSRRGSAPYVTGDDAPGHGSAHLQAPPFSVSFAGARDLEDEAPSPSPLPPAPFGTPVSALLMGPREVPTPLSMLLIVAADVGLQQIFGRLGWSFPSSVAGMVGLFAGLVGLDRIAPSYAQRVVRLLEPGSAEFSRWLPVVLVPSLVRWSHFPLASLTGSSASLAEVVVTAAKAAARHAAGRVSKDYGFSRFPAGGRPSGSRLRAVANVTKVLMTGAGGWLAHFSSTAVVVTVLSWLSSPSTPSSRSTSITLDTAATPAVSSTLPTESVRRPTRGGLFGARLVRRLGIGTVASGAASVTIFELIFPWVPFSLESFSWFGVFFIVGLIPAFVGVQASMGLATLFGYSAGHVAVSPGGALGSRRSAWKAALLPLATSMAATAITGASVASPLGIDIRYMRDSYFQDGLELGAGDVLFRLLGPAVLSFAAPLFRMRGFIVDNARPVLGGSIFCAATSLFGISLISRLLGVPKAFQVAFQAEAPPSRVSKVRKALRVLFTGPDREIRLSVASALGVYKTPAIAGVLVLTGVLGTCFGPWVLDALGAKDPMVRALIQGGTSSVFGIEATSEPREVHRKRPDNSTAGVPPSTGDVSTVAMVLTGAAGTVLVNIPWVRSALLSIALGSTVAGAEMPLSP